MAYAESMTARGLLLTLLVGGIVAMFGSLYVRLPAERQEQLKLPVYIACGLGIAVGIGILAVGFLGGFD